MTEMNYEIKLEAIKKGVKLYQIPPKLGISMSTFERLMRNPLTDENRQKMLKAVEEIVAQKSF